MSAKTLTLPELQKKVAAWRLMSNTIVFTNGCFDILHKGHVTYLQAAKKKGNKLIVGLNSDASVKQLEKGDSRPLQDENSRAIILAALTAIDAVVIFEENTPLDLIKAIQPDVLVKGGDWQPKDIVGSDVVLNNGGKVESIPFVEGHSTTSIEEKIKNS